MRPLVAVVGLTASGKTELAIRIAERLDGAVVNADSRQVYRGMDIGTAKPAVADRARVPHYLFDVADPRDGYSLALYVRQATAVLNLIWAGGQTPVLCGGTGQYVWALLEGWTVPEVEPNPVLRARLRRLAEESGPEALHSRLAAVDPVAAARIDARNERRVVRALEVYESTGTPISAAQSKSAPGFAWRAIGLDVPRPELDRRINARTEAMFDGGFVDEVRQLLAAGLPPDAPAMSSIGYREVAACLAGELTLPEASARTAQLTRRLARRQQQWFRRGDSRIHWVTGIHEGIEVAARD